MAGERDDIQELLVDINRDLACRLRCVNGKRNAGLAAVAADLPNRLNCADHIGCMVDNDQAGVRPEPLADLIGIKLPESIIRQSIKVVK
jgi:hypothetical protein